jgi:hypothetical protein
MMRGWEGVRGDDVFGVYVCERRSGLTDAVCVLKVRELAGGELGRCGSWNFENGN